MNKGIDDSLAAGADVEVIEDPAEVDAMIDEMIDNAERTAGREPQSRQAIGTSMEMPGCCATGFELTDQGNSFRLISRYGEDMRYTPGLGWLIWDGAQWNIDDLGQAIEFAKATARLIHDEATAVPKPGKGATKDEKAAYEFLVKALHGWAERSESITRTRALLDLAATDVAIAVSATNLDKDPWLLNVLNGTIDLRTGKLMPHTRADLLTMRAPIAYDAAAECPTWDAFLLKIMAGRQDMVDFMRRLVGSFLSGENRDQKLFMAYGDGSNGKGTFIRAVNGILGDYARTADVKTFLEASFDNDGSSHSEDVARLRSARFVAAEEANPNKRLNIGRLKNLTGGDRIVARRPHGLSFEFVPQFKILLAVNHKPDVPTTDYGTWRRVRLIPFVVRITEVERMADPGFETRLRLELPGILAWAVRGCLEWQEVGLAEPQEVIAATVEYKTEQDIMGSFIDEMCVLGPDHEVTSSALYRAYVTWSKDTGRHPLAQGNFGIRLMERGAGVESMRMGHDRTRGYRGIGLRIVLSGIDELYTVSSGDGAAQEKRQIVN